MKNYSNSGKVARMLRFLSIFYGTEINSDKISEDYFSLLVETIGHYDNSIYVKFINNLKRGLYKKYAHYQPSIAAMAYEFRQISNKQSFEFNTQLGFKEDTCSPELKSSDDYKKFLKLKERLNGSNMGRKSR